MSSLVQHLATDRGMSYYEFVGEMRKRGCSEPTACKIWNGAYEDSIGFMDNDIHLSSLRKAADVLKAPLKMLLPD